MTDYIERARELAREHGPLGCATLAAKLEADLKHEHDNFLTAHRDNMKAATRIMELKAENDRLAAELEATRRWGKGIEAEYGAEIDRLAAELEQVKSWERRVAAEHELIALANDERDKMAAELAAVKQELKQLICSDYCNNSSGHKARCVELAPAPGQAKEKCRYCLNGSCYECRKRSQFACWVCKKPTPYVQNGDCVCQPGDKSEPAPEQPKCDCGQELIAGECPIGLSEDADDVPAPSTRQDAKER